MIKFGDRIFSMMTIVLHIVLEGKPAKSRLV